MISRLKLPVRGSELSGRFIQDRTPYGPLYVCLIPEGGNLRITSFFTSLVANKNCPHIFFLLLLLLYRSRQSIEKFESFSCVSSMNNLVSVFLFDSVCLEFVVEISRNINFYKFFLPKL